QTQTRAQEATAQQAEWQGADTCIDRADSGDAQVINRPLQGWGLGGKRTHNRGKACGDRVTG
ncbi:MAG: hypothetical protein AB7G75_35030, partial [Candidatus Binatia bacterium]